MNQLGVVCAMRATASGEGKKGPEAVARAGAGPRLECLGTRGVSLTPSASHSSLRRAPFSPRSLPHKPRTHLHTMGIKVRGRSVRPLILPPRAARWRTPEPSRALLSRVTSFFQFPRSLSHAPRPHPLSPPPQSLSKLLGDNAPACRRDQKFDNYFGRKIAVDASMHIYQFMVSVKNGKAQGDAPSHRRTRSHPLLSLFHAGRHRPRGRPAADGRDGRGH